ncbi:MAG: LysM peptidoglycan-binding domain-containing protein [Alphaproteobacteria bacterium]|nr:LysM peptidoglycan-binding domain-containing protein [Alphaproteobacteria bacterium]
MKRNAFFIGLILLFVTALCFVFYPKNKSDTIISAPEEQIDKHERTTVERPVAEAKKEMIVSGLKASFDIVRVEEDGSMVAAGKGKKGAVVSLMDGEKVLTRFSVNDDGEWIFIPTEPLAAGEHEIWLQDDSMNSREQSEVIVVSVPEPKNAGQALAVMMSPDAQQVEVLQAPVPQVEAEIDIRSVNYVNNAFVINGTVRDSGRINVYLDNLFLGNVTAEQPDWLLRVSKRLQEGKKYQIRADKVDARGKVIARIEVPFEMEKGLDKTKRRHIRVIKGDCLWAIAKQLYGSGFAYVTIYQANKNQIKNPDLIYPNQVFVLPVKSEK